MKALITGATGFIGARLLEALTPTAYEVHAVARRPGPPRAARWYEADLLDEGQRRRLVAEVGATHLIHLAWTAEHGAFWDSPLNEDWRSATIDLVDQFGRHGGRRAILVGSCAEYDWTAPELREAGCSEATTPLNPASAYGRAKLAAFRSASTLAADQGISLVWARLFFLFGINEHPDRLVPALIRAALRGINLELEHPGRVLDFSSTAEVAAALAHLLGDTIEGPVNVASGRGVRLDDLAAMIYRLAGATPEDAADGPTATDLRLVADVTRLSTEARFDPKHDLGESLTPVVAWWQRRAHDG